MKVDRIVIKPGNKIEIQFFEEPKTLKRASVARWKKSTDKEEFGVLVGTPSFFRHLKA